jgi:hypothetical protein
MVARTPNQLQTHKVTEAARPTFSSKNAQEQEQKLNMPRNGCQTMTKSSNKKCAKAPHNQWQEHQ